MTRDISTRRDYILGLARLWKVFGVFNPTLNREQIFEGGTPIGASELCRLYPLCFDQEDDSDEYTIILLARKK